MRIAYYILHYGKEYLAWSVQSIQDVVDEIHVLYTDSPSHGHYPDHPPCPDSRDQLFSEANRFLKDKGKLHWHEGHWPNEGAHRDEIRQIGKTRGASSVLVVDADELWNAEEAVKAMDFAENSGAGSTLVRFTHFWRSLYWSCEDGSMPVRVLNLNYPHNTVAYLSPQTWPVFHMGYAQSEAIMRYKWEIHGHKRELIQGWMENTFLNWQKGIDNVHPTTSVIWNPRPTSSENIVQLKLLLKDHPYWDTEIIR